MNREDVIEEHGFFYGMAWFRAFRNEYGFAWYGDNRTPVSFDFPLVTVTYLCAVVGVATLISSLGIRGRERWATTLRATYAVGLASVILVCLVGHDWRVGRTEVKTHYLYRSDNYFRGSVGLRIALHGCNVTLEGYYSGANGEGHVYYGESMQWKDYGKEQETIQPYLQKGLPHPVLTVLDFLSADGGGFRWGRSFHSSGYFGSALLWTAFAFWLISNVLLMSVVSYGAFMFILTGVAMVLSCVVYHVCQPPHPLHVHFGDSLLTTSYGWCFWLTLAAGIVTLVLGATLFVCDHVFHEKVSEFFNLDKLDEDEQQPDFLPYPPDISGKMPGKQRSGSLPGAMLMTTSANSSRSGSLHPTPVDTRRGSAPPPQIGQQQAFINGQQVLLQIPRRTSLFLAPERRGSDARRASLFTRANGVGGAPGGGFTNKGFEQEQRPVIKTNPLFNANATTAANGDILLEESVEGDKRLREVRVEVEREREAGEVGEQESRSGSGSESGYSNRKPSLATMREHRENHLNQQKAGSQGQATVTCTAVIIEPPIDEDNDDKFDEDGGEHSDDGKKKRSSSSTAKAGSSSGSNGGKGETTADEEEHRGHESGTDSAINSWSPSGSEKNSTCDECEIQSAHF